MGTDSEQNGEAALDAAGKSGGFVYSAAKMGGKSTMTKAAMEKFMKELTDQQLKDGKVVPGKLIVGNGSLYVYDEAALSKADFHEPPSPKADFWASAATSAAAKLDSFVEEAPVINWDESPVAPKFKPGQPVMSASTGDMQSFYASHAGKFVPASAATPSAEPHQPVAKSSGPEVPFGLDELPGRDETVAAWTAYNRVFATPVVTLDEHGWAERFANHGLIPANTVDLGARIREISMAWAGGKIIGVGRTLMPKHLQEAWLDAFYCGNFDACFSIEAAVASPVRRHPGHPNRPDTHHLIWQPDTPGMVPAGQALPGRWSSPHLRWSAPELRNYLLGARCPNVDWMASDDRREWVRAHQAGDAVFLDRMNRRVVEARKSAYYHPDNQSGPYTRLTEWYDSFVHPIQDLDTTPPHEWSHHSLRAYAEQHGLPFRHTYARLYTQVRAHRAAVAAGITAAGTMLTFSYAPDQQPLSGYHRKAWLVDQRGDKWIFKPVKDDAHRFRAETEHEAHVLARLWGFKTAESHLIDFDGMYGQVQRALPVERNFLSITDQRWSELSVEQLTAIACEHLLDWALDNDDTHGDNLVQLTDGSIVGIDKGRAWRYFGGWPGLTGNDRADTNCALVITRFFTAVAAGTFLKPTIDHIYGAVLARARRMQTLPDETLRQIILRAVKHRPHYNAPSYQAVVKAAPTSEQELLDAAVARKNQLVADMETLWAHVYHAAGWPVPPGTTACGSNNHGQVIHTNLHAPELHHTVMATKSFGTPVFFAGADIEDAHMLLWRERAAVRNIWQVRGELKLRFGAVFDQVDTWCRDHAKVDPGLDKVPSVLQDEPYYHKTIVGAAKTISWHNREGDKHYNSYKMQCLVDVISMLTRIRDQDPSVMYVYPAVHGIREQAVAMASLYLDYIDRIQRHKDEGTWSDGGDFPRFEFEPKLTPPKPTQVLVKRVVPSRAAAVQETEPLNDEGELVVGRQHHSGPEWGQPGMGYLIALPTGETLEWRGSDAFRSQAGMLRFTIPNAADMANGLRHIETALAEIGVELTSADELDLELFYWRHLYGIMSDRADTHDRHDVSSKFHTFWKACPAWPGKLSREDELAKWRVAFSYTHHSPAEVKAFTTWCENRNWLPRLGHQDLRNPAQPCGKPFWDRHDVTLARAHHRPMPIVAYRSGPDLATYSGLALSTEARSRILGIWKSGVSSLEDMRVGSGGFCFLRQNVELSPAHAPSLYFNPHILRRTSNYAYSSDRYGRIDERREFAHWVFESMTAPADNHNELLVKDALTLLDDIEIIAFADHAHRERALAFFAQLGITELRGLSLEQRFIIVGDNYGRREAARLVRTSWQS